MALGGAHDRAIILTAPIVAIASFLAIPSVAFFVVIGHVFGGLFLSPDLDTVSRPYNRWGLLKYYWFPYRKTMKHRGASHAPVIGTLSRIGYLLILPIGVIAYYDIEVPWECWKEGLAFIVGVEISARVHLLLDGIWRQI